MSTRANLIVYFGSSRVFLYRHHDGYLAGMGADIARKLAAAGNSANLFLRALMDESYEQQSYESEPRRVYELTNDVHGDIEYLYSVRFSDHSSHPPEVGYLSFAIGAPGRNDRAVVPMRRLDQFVISVNGDIRAQNGRLAELRESQPAAYGKYENEPEVALGVANG